MKKLIYVNLLLLLTGIAPFLQATEAPEMESKAVVTLYNVGVGQCCAVEMYDAVKKSKKNMLIGFGIEEKGSESSLVQENSISSSPSKSILKLADYQALTSIHPLSSQELIRELRAKFKKSQEGEGIEVDTVILTHPMKDPGLLMDLFSKQTDHVDKLFLTGMPEEYYKDRLPQFQAWLEEKRLKKTNILFVGVDRIHPRHSGSLYLEENRKYRDPWFTHSVKEGEEQLNYGSIKVSFLAVNATHFRGYAPKSFGIEDKQEVIRSAFPEDTNSDSLIIKIAHGVNSILLTGNATSLTTNRALNNYIDKPASLKANVLVASLYGSVSQGANNSKWVKAVEPEYVLVSHGASQATVDQQAVESFKASKRLKTSIKDHEIEVQVPETQKYTTNQGIFSTLNSGTIILALYKKRLILKTEKEGEITELKAIDQLAKREDVLSPRTSELSQSSPVTGFKRTQSTSSSPTIVRQKEKEALSSSHKAKTVRSVSSSSKLKKASKGKEKEKVKALPCVKESKVAKKTLKVLKDELPKKSSQAVKSSTKSIKKKEEVKKMPSDSSETTDDYSYESNPITQESTPDNSDSGDDYDDS
jgi:hypothetical protein